MNEIETKAQQSLLRAFYQSKGIDIHLPQKKSIRCVTLDEKNREHEEWHAEFERFQHARLEES
jgi:hypothetical protein